MDRFESASGVQGQGCDESQRAAWLEEEQAPLLRELLPPRCHPTFPAISAEGTPEECYVYSYVVLLSAPTSEGLNASPEAKQPFQEMEFDS